MKRATFIAFLFFAVQTTQAQQPVMKQRKEGESLQQFALRVISKDDRLNHVVEGDFGTSRGNVVIFFDRTDANGTFLNGWVLVPDESGGYRKYEIDADGYAPSATVKSIFFTNADSDTEKELVVLTSALSQLLIEGKRVEVCSPYIFDWNGSGFTYLQSVSENLTLQSDKCNAAEARRLLNANSNIAQMKKGASGSWEWTSRPNKNKEQSYFSVDLEQRNNTVRGRLWFGMLVEGENDGADSSFIPFIGTVIGDVITIEFDPADVHTIEEENVRYRKPKGKSPSTATLSLKSDKLEWALMKGKLADFMAGVPRQFTMRRVK